MTTSEMVQEINARYDDTVEDDTGGGGDGGGGGMLGDASSTAATATKITQRKIVKARTRGSNDDDGEDDEDNGGGGGDADHDAVKHSAQQLMTPTATLEAFLSHVYSDVQLPIKNNNATNKIRPFWMLYSMCRVASACEVRKFNRRQVADNGALRRMIENPLSFDYSSLHETNIDDHTTALVMYMLAVENESLRIYKEMQAEAFERVTPANIKMSLQMLTTKYTKPSEVSAAVEYRPYYLMHNKIDALVAELKKKQPPNAPSPNPLGVNILGPIETDKYVKALHSKATCAISGIELGTVILSDSPSVPSPVITVNDMAVVKWTFSYTPMPPPQAAHSAAASGHGSDDDDDEDDDSDDDDATSRARKKAKKQQQQQQQQGASAAAGKQPEVQTHTYELLVLKMLAVHWRALFVLRSPLTLAVTMFNRWINDKDVRVNRRDITRIPLRHVAHEYVSTQHGIDLVDEYQTMSTTLRILQYNSGIGTTIFNRVYNTLATIDILAKKQRQSAVAMKD